VVDRVHGGVRYKAMLSKFGEKFKERQWQQMWWGAAGWGGT
jgi:hypothetical protein